MNTGWIIDRVRLQLSCLDIKVHVSSSTLYLATHDVTASLLAHWLLGVRALLLLEFLSVLFRRVQVSGGFRSQAGSGLQTGSGLRRFRSQSGSGLRRVQVYRRVQVSDGFRSQAGSGLQTGSGLRRFRSTGRFRSQSGSGLRRVQVYRRVQFSVRFRSQAGSGLSQVQVYRELKKMMMKVMMKVVVLLLSGLLCVSSEVLHEDIYVNGCSDSDGEYMYGLEGEVVWYADFKHKRGVEPQPSFIDHLTYPGAYEQAVANQQTCKINLEIDRKAFKDFPLEQDAPSSPMIYPRDQVEPGDKNILICHVTGFYPAPVTFSWTKNEENITEGTSVNVPSVNKDGTYHQFSRLEFTPHLGDIYGCTVKHLGLEQTRFWDVEKTQPSIGPAVFCGLGLTVGLLGVAAGTFFLIKGNECS